MENPMLIISYHIKKDGIREVIPTRNYFHHGTKELEMSVMLKVEVFLIN